MSRKQKNKMNPQIVELVGRNWVVRQLLDAGLEVAVPMIDHGVDLIAYSVTGKTFVACPIQLKVSSGEHFGIYKKYRRTPGLLIVHIWEALNPRRTAAFAVTHKESVRIGRTVRWTKTFSWKKKKGSYTTRKPTAELKPLLEPFRMNPQEWRRRLVGLQTSR